MRRALSPRAAVLMVAVAAQLLLAACGSSSKPPAAPQAAEAAAQQQAVEALPAAPGAKGTDNVTRDSGPVRAAESPGDDADAGKQPGRARAWNPCRLVTRAEARGIVGKAVATQLGKQGPTCIYSSRAPRQSLTVALQPASVAELTRGQRGLIDVPLRGRNAVCVSAGGPKLIVPIAGGGVLNVGGSCALATQFALKALDRLPG